MRIRAIVCEVLYREFAYCAAKSRNVVDLDFVTQGLHDVGCDRMCARLQAEIDATEAERYDAVILGYALCSNGIVGLQARGVPVVIPRAHDCVSLLLGSRKLYDKIHSENPGTYFLSTGWCERDGSNLEKMENSILDSLGFGRSYEDYVRDYGEENAKFIMESLKGGLQHYSRFLFIRLGLGPEDGQEAEARERAAANGWDFDMMDGDLGLLQRLCDGDWNGDEFIILKPGSRVAAVYDGDIIKSVE
jgi:hypothetical protein